ncbi:hypothetical protein CCP2SC5_580020 [Azospirillaceae bacterium]
MSTVGLAGTAVERVEDYVTCAARWAEDRERLIETRQTLRERFAASALCDSRRFAENFLRIVQEVV